jgi:predicted deacylase
MDHLGMIEAPEITRASKLLTDSWWVRTPRGQGGIYLPSVRLGDSVSGGQLLATVTDPVTDARHEIRADQAGVIVGMALPQVVLSGYGLFHVGVLE